MGALAENEGSPMSSEKKKRRAKPFYPAMSDHDLLIRIDERQTTFEDTLDKHLAHHWATTLTAVTAVLGAALTIVVIVFRT